MDTSTIRATPTTTAAAFATELRANVDEWYRQENTPENYEAFGAKNRATWERIEAAGAKVNDEVQRILRGTAVSAMFLLIGKRQYPVASLAEASVRYQLSRGARPSSRMPLAVVVDDAGRTVARVSYNGRVWSPDEPRKLLWEAADGDHAPADTAGSQPRT